MQISITLWVKSYVFLPRVLILSLVLIRSIRAGRLSSASSGCPRNFATLDEARQDSQPPLPWLTFASGRFHIPKTVGVYE